MTTHPPGGTSRSRRLGINALEEELSEAADFCRSEGIGLEVVSFAYPAALDADLDGRIERHRKALTGVPWVSLHGPFLDLHVTSPDPAIVEVCERRHRAALRAAGALEARLYVAHLNSLPQIRNEAYLDRFVGGCADFWLPLADEAGRAGVVIALENMWEASPDLQRSVVERAEHPHLRASFDNGHALVFSSTAATDWIATLGDALAHCHLHDNDGSYDRHWAVGRGAEDWPALAEALRAHAPGCPVVLEGDRLEVNRESLGAARTLLA